MRKWTWIIILVLLSVTWMGVAAQEDVTANPGGYVGEVVTVEGVANIISNNVVELVPINPDISPANILVMPYPNGEFGIDINNGMRIQATGTLYNFDVASVEAVVNYDVDETQLTDYTAEDFALVATQVMQVGGPRTATGGVTVSEFEANPEQYYEGTLTVEGVTNILSNNVVELTDTQPFSLVPDSLLIVPGPDGQFSIDVNNGQRVRVTGTFRTADQAALETDLGYDLDDNAFGAFDTEDHVIIAQDITLLSMADVNAGTTALNELTADPAGYYGQQVTVSGYIAEAADPAAGNFVIRSGDLLTSNRAVVFTTQDSQAMMGTTMTSPLAVGDRVVVTGTVRQMTMADLETELGYDLNDDLYANYSDLPAIVATSIEAAPENMTGTQPMTDGAATTGDGATTAGQGAFDESVYADYPVDDNASLDDVTDNPDVYYGTIVTVSGTTSTDDLLGGGRSFYLWDDDLIGPDPALILGANQATWDAIALLEGDTEIAVRGVVRVFNIIDLENELGYDLIDADFAGIEDDVPAIIALEVIPGIE